MGRSHGAGAGLPVLFAVRRVLEEANRVDEAVELMRSIRRTVPQNYLLADASRGVVLETGVERFRVREMADDWVAVGNLYDEDKESHPRGRYRQMSDLLREGTAKVPQLQELLEKVALGDLNVQAVVLEPARRHALVATERRPAARGPWRSIDLSRWLEAPPDQPTAEEKVATE